VNLDQRIQKISLGIFEVRSENGFGVKRRWKRIWIH